MMNLVCGLFRLFSAAFTFQHLWLWFVAQPFGVLPVSLVHALALDVFLSWVVSVDLHGVMVHLAMFKELAVTDKEWQWAQERWALSFIASTTAWATLGLGWCLHWLMLRGY